MFAIVCVKKAMGSGVLIRVTDCAGVPGLGGEEAGDCALREKVEMPRTANMSPRTLKPLDGAGSL
jgi:hypothetical protein